MTEIIVFASLADVKSVFVFTVVISGEFFDISVLSVEKFVESCTKLEIKPNKSKITVSFKL